MPADGHDRRWELDALRGVAMLMMIAYHLVWDLYAYEILPIDLYGTFWVTFQRSTASLFLLLVGVALRLRRSRLLRAQRPAEEWPRLLRRAGTVLAGGLAVTLVTLVAVPVAPVVFGILHLIAATMLLAHPFQRLGVYAALVGAVTIALGPIVSQTLVPWPWLLWLGLRHPNFASVDYFPLIPWFGVVLIGLALGALAYDQPRPPLWPRARCILPIAALTWLGRRALPVYLIHQPALVVLLVATGLLPLSRLL